MSSLNLRDNGRGKFRNLARSCTAAYNKNKRTNGPTRLVDITGDDGGHSVVSENAEVTTMIRNTYDTFQSIGLAVSAFGYGQDWQAG